MRVCVIAKHHTQLLHGIGPGGAEHEGLSVRAGDGVEDGANVVDETHVQHAVGCQRQNGECNRKEIHQTANKQKCKNERTKTITL